MPWPASREWGHCLIFFDEKELIRCGIFNDGKRRSDACDGNELY
jgi:hypothetical protein